MATSIPQVRVAPVAGEWELTCSQCPDFRPSFLFRGVADVQAIDHQRSHTTQESRC